MNFSVKYIFDFFLPRICPGCNKKLASDEKSVCIDCLSSILIADEVRLQNEYDRKFSSEKIIEDFYARYVFETDKTLQHIIHALKYQKQFKLGTFLGEILSEGTKSRNWQIDLIVPIPIHHLKKAERGYNQSDYLAKGLSKGLNVPYSTKLIKRTRHTNSQTRLHIKERAINIADAFKVKRSEEIENKNVLVVDDVSTTGATILECAKMIKSAGAKTIYACTVGTTSLEDDSATFSQAQILQE
jgi:ComF family protein